VVELDDFTGRPHQYSNGEDRIYHVMPQELVDTWEEHNKYYHRRRSLFDIFVSDEEE